MYDAQPSRDYCKQIGLQLVEADFEEFGRLAEKHKFTQEQIDFTTNNSTQRIEEHTIIIASRRQ